MANSKRLLAAWVDAATHKTIRAAATRDHRTVSDVVRFAVERYLEQGGKEGRRTA